MGYGNSLFEKISEILETPSPSQRRYAPPEFWAKVAGAKKVNAISDSGKTRLLGATQVSPDRIDGALSYGHQELLLVKLAAKWVNRYCTYRQIQATVSAVLDGATEQQYTHTITIEAESWQ